MPKDAPNFAVFAALDQDIGTVHVGDILKVDVVAVQSRDQKAGGEGECYPTIWAYNRAESREEFQLDDNRFWHSTGQKKDLFPERASKKTQ